MSNERFKVLNAASCLEKRIETFKDGAIILAEAGVFSETINVVPCHNTQVNFADCCLWGSFDDIRNFYFKERRKEPYEPSECEKVHGAFLGIDPKGEQELWDSIGEGFPHIDLENYTLNTSVWTTCWMNIKGMPKNARSNFAFSFIDEGGMTTDTIDGNYKGDNFVHYPYYAPRFGAWGDRKATPFALRYVLNKFRTAIIANSAEHEEVDSRELMPIEDVNKMHKFILHDIKTREHTQRAIDYGPIADSLAGF